MSDDPLEQFLTAYPQYREHVVWSESHRAWSMPAWLADRFRLWLLAQQQPPGRN